MAHLHRIYDIISRMLRRSRSKVQQVKRMLFHLYRGRRRRDTNRRMGGVGLIGVSGLKDRIYQGDRNKELL
jgi:hypothetical protein